MPPENGQVFLSSKHEKCHFSPVSCRGGRRRRPRASKAGGHPKSEITEIKML